VNKIVHSEQTFRIPSPWGCLRAAVDSERSLLLSLSFLDERETREENGLQPLAGTIRSLAIAPATTRFLRSVRTVVCSIPPGETRTYAEVAAEAGHPGAARAVGQAMARNPVALRVPCHRVVPTGSGWGGYRWGVAMPEAMARQIRRYVNDGATGELIIDRFGEVRHRGA